MPKPRSHWLDYVVYLAVRLVIALVQAVPEDLAWCFARGLGRLAYLIDRRHRLVAHDNLRHAYPHCSDERIDRMVRAVYRNCLLMFFEMILMPRKYRAANLPRYVRYVPEADYERAVSWARCGRPLLVLSGHFGNWETVSYISGMYGFRGGIIARRLDNPHLDRFLKRFRVATGQVILDKNEDYARIQETLASGGKLGMVGDQDAGARGVFVDFFGRPASTFKAIALLSLEYSAPILVLLAARRRPLHFDVHLADVILPEDYAGQPNAVRLITERYTRALERIIRLHPEQYFWLHRRWKHAPPKRSQRQQAA